MRASGTSYVSESYRGLVGMRIDESQWNFSRESGTLELELLHYEPEVLVLVDWNELLRVVCPQPGTRLSLDEERGSHGMHELVSNGQVRGSSCADLNVYDARNSLTDVTLPLSVTL